MGQMPITPNYPKHFLHIQTLLRIAPQNLVEIMHNYGLELN